MLDATSGSGLPGQTKQADGHCDSERPIFLLNVLSKALKAVVLHRLMAQLEKSLAGCQYGYRRERGTGHRLLELAEFVREMRASQRFVDIASVDVVGAFATVPRKKLMEVGGALGVDSFSCRYLSGWLAGRVFVYPSAPLSVSPQMAVGISPSGARVCLPKWLSVYPLARVCPHPSGRFYSSWRCLSRGLPQGGVLCPILRLLHLNPLVPRRKGVRQQGSGPAREVAVRFWLYAGDVVCVMADWSQPTLRLAA